MTNFFKKLIQEDNLIIVIPGVIVVLLVITFMAYGFSQPRSTTLSEVDNMLTRQTRLEADMIAEYEEGAYTKIAPYIKVNPYEISPLSALIMFGTVEQESVKVVILGTEDNADIEFITNEVNFHQIPIYGLYEGTNTIEIYNYSTDDQTVGDLVFTTQIETVVEEEDLLKLPDATIDTTYDYFQDDLMLLSPATNGYPVGYDYNGDIRWYFNIALGFGIDVLSNGHLLIGTDRVMSDPYYTTGIYEIDMLGKIYKEYYIPGGFHHDALELPGGNLLVLTSSFEGAVEDVVVEIDKDTGNIVKEWILSDYLPMTEGMSAMWTSSDWFHNNSVDYDPITDSIILSGRHQDVVISIGYTSNTLNWVLGDPENWDQEGFTDQYFFTPIGTNFEWQYAQHSAIVLPNGNIFLFDNGNNKSKNSENYVAASDSYSRGVIYDIDTTAMTIEQVFEYGKALGSDFYSPYISNVAYYADGNYMIHSGGIAYSSETGPLNIPAPLYHEGGTVYENSITVELQNNEVVYRLRVSGNYYRATKITPYDDVNGFTLGEGVSLGNQEVTAQYTEQLNSSYTLFQTLPKKYELSLEKETDRLVVEGVFNRYDEIYLVLEGSEGTLTYHIPTSTSAYTAMCSAVFQGDERFISFYVNEQNITGRYRIYLHINGKEYDTYQVVEFK